MADDAPYKQLEAGARSDMAREAFANRDPERSKAVHTLAAHSEPTNPEGKYLKPIIFGGLDGISTIFAFLAGAVGANLTLVSIIALGCAQLFAGAFGMGFGEYVSSEGERQVAAREEAREHWEVENHPEGEVAEMIMIYKEKGLSEEDAKLVADTLSKYKDFWVEHMMVTEIGMFPADDDKAAAIIQGIIMFCSFLFLGSIPLIAYCMSMFLLASEGTMFAMGVSCAAAVASLAALGMVKARMVDLPVIQGGLSMAVQGILSAGGAYVIGTSLPDWLGLQA
jgi:DNA damage-binding protein 1